MINKYPQKNPQVKEKQPKALTMTGKGDCDQLKQDRKDTKR